MTGLTVQDLGLVRSERQLFAALSFSLSPGDALVLVGPNGTGKSSLLRVLAGLLKPTDGSIIWDGIDISEDPEHYHRAMHFVGHLDGVKPVMTVAENLAFWSRLRGGGDHEQALDHFGLAGLADIPARFLSAGQKRRLGIARIMASPGLLWLLDEPTVSLDSASVAALADAMKAHRADGGIVVAATHAELGLIGAKRLDLGAYHQ